MIPKITVVDPNIELAEDVTFTSKTQGDSLEFSYIATSDRLSLHYESVCYLKSDILNYEIDNVEDYKLTPTPLVMSSTDRKIDVARPQWLSSLNQNQLKAFSATNCSLQSLLDQEVKNSCFNL
ncbi:hypothetical protein H4Q26_007773 [Puccinia striiformis f. sp. tritici PST-130]|nr:hypothetical protein H4Q26_007773 [Puccinia striiformis f. sp. tritici PST-130]